MSLLYLLYTVLFIAILVAISVTELAPVGTECSGYVQKIMQPSQQLEYTYISYITHKRQYNGLLNHRYRLDSSLDYIIQFNAHQMTQRCRN